MRRTPALLMLAGAALALGGCVAGMAASAIGAAAQAGRSKPQPWQADAGLRAAAETACRARASAYGVIRIIDIEQRSATGATVWGTATATTGRQSFECRYDRTVVAFKLRKL